MEKLLNLRAKHSRLVQEEETAAARLVHEEEERRRREEEERNRAEEAARLDREDTSRVWLKRKKWIATERKISLLLIDLIHRLQHRRKVTMVSFLALSFVSYNNSIDRIKQCCLLEQ